MTQRSRPEIAGYDCFGEAGQVAGIGEIFDAEAKRSDVAMGLVEDGHRDGAAGPIYLEYIAGDDLVGVENRRIVAARGRYKAIAEGFANRAPASAVK